MKLRVVATLILSVFLLSSCVDNIDFDQAQNLQLNPVIVGSIAYGDVTQEQLLNDSGQEIPQFLDEVDFQLFNNRAAQEDLVKVAFYFEATNQFDRDFVLTVSFLDENDIEVYQVQNLQINQGELNFKHTEEVIIANNLPILTARKLRTVFSFPPSSDGSVITTSDTRKLTFKSSATFYFKIDL